jgi:hypothetical protein
VPLHSCGLLFGAQGPVKRSSPPDLPLFFSLIIVWLSFHLQFCLPRPVLSSIKTTASSMSIYPVAGSSPISSPIAAIQKDRGLPQFHWQLGFKARNADFNDCSCMNQVAARHPNKHRKHQSPGLCFATDRGPTQATTCCPDDLKTPEMPLKTDKTCKTS